MLIEILWIVFFVLGLVFFYPPAAATAPWPWAPHLYYMLMFGLTGLVLFDGLSRLAPLR